MQLDQGVFFSWTTSAVQWSVALLASSVSVNTFGMLTRPPLCQSTHLVCWQDLLCVSQHIWYVDKTSSVSVNTFGVLTRPPLCQSTHLVCWQDLLCVSQHIWCVDKTSSVSVNIFGVLTRPPGSEQAAERILTGLPLEVSKYIAWQPLSRLWGEERLDVYGDVAQEGGREQGGWGGGGGEEEEQRCIKEFKCTWEADQRGIALASMLRGAVKTQRTCRHSAVWLSRGSEDSKNLPSFCCLVIQGQWRQQEPAVILLFGYPEQWRQQEPAVILLFGYPGAVKTQRTCRHSAVWLSRGGEDKNLPLFCCLVIQGQWRHKEPAVILLFGYPKVEHLIFCSDAGQGTLHGDT